MRTVKDKLIDVCIIVTVALVMAAGLEITARIAMLIRDMVASSPVDEIILKQEWGKQYLADGFRAPQMQQMTYVEFRPGPYTSATINVDNEGRRKVPQNCERENAFTVFMFGGSTMFGVGVPDQFTIPADLAETLNQEGRCIRVFNYGAGWWQSTQSVVQLLETLEKGARPHAVVFYDGINDIDTVSYGGVAGGITANVDSFLKQAFASNNGQDSLIKRIAQSSVFVHALRTRLLPNPQMTAENTYRVPTAEMPELANAIANVYANNVRSTEALAKEYGFAAYFFLQPFPLIAGKTKTDLEQLAFRERTTNREWEPDFIRLCYPTLCVAERIAKEISLPVPAN